MKIKNMTVIRRIGSLGLALALATASLWPLIALADSEWNQVEPPNSPDARDGHSMVTFDDGSVMIFGGENANGDLFNDVAKFQAGNWQKEIPNNTPPAPRRDHRVWVEGQKMMVYGGKGAGEELYNDLWSYDRSNKEWAQVQLPAIRPLPRRGHSTTRLADGSTIIFGGIGENGTVLADCWKYNQDNTFTRLSNIPNAFSYHSVQVVGDLLLVFGIPGMTGIYQISTNNWMLAPSGIPSSGHAVSGKGQNEQGEDIIYLFGGYDAGGNESDVVHEFNLDTGAVTQREERMPFPLVDSAGAMIPDTQTNVFSGNSQRRVNAQSTNQVSILLFGGKRSDGTIISTTYTFEPPAPSTSVVISPAAGGRLVFTDTQGLTTTVDVPFGAVSEPITLTYTMLYVPTQPISPALGLAGHAFTLEAFQNGTVQLGFVFSKPITVVIHYSDADIAGMDENTLTLNYWDGSQWTDAAATCTPASIYERHPDENWLSVPICHLSEFVLLGEKVNHIYLPLVWR